MRAAANQIESIAAGALRRISAVAVDSIRGCRYWRAAENDERNGFPFTAAVEWQRAAECFACSSLLADQCWRQWERIVHLPRELSRPIGEPEMLVVHCVAATPAARPIDVTNVVAVAA